MALRLRKIKIEDGRVIPYPSFLHNNLMDIVQEDGYSYLVFVEHDAEPMPVEARVDSDVELVGA